MFFNIWVDYEQQIIQSACQNIKEHNSLVALETSQVIAEEDLIIRSLNSLQEEEYQEIKAENDPADKNSLIRFVVGLFMAPNYIFVDTDQSIELVESTIVHEVQHYRNRDKSLDEVEDEISAKESEDRYIGRYITRKYMRDLRVAVNAEITGRVAPSGGNSPSPPQKIA